MNYALADKAKFDLNEILNYCVRHRGDDAAFQLEGDLLDAFNRLAVNPGLGHRRQNLTSRAVFFYPVDPYLVIYKRETDPLLIVRILHSARDLRKILKSRS